MKNNLISNQQLYFIVWAWFMGVGLISGNYLAYICAIFSIIMRIVDRSER